MELVFLWILVTVAAVSSLWGLFMLCSAPAWGYDEDDEWYDWEVR